jgi:hypothetical protein
MRNLINSTKRRSATIVIRQRDPELETDDGYLRESVHEDELERDELGVTIHFGDVGGGDTFVPWPSVVRIDIEPWCACFRCRRPEALAA